MDDNIKKYNDPNWLAGHSQGEAADAFKKDLIASAENGEEISLENVMANMDSLLSPHEQQELAKHLVKSKPQVTANYGSNAALDYQLVADRVAAKKHKIKYKD